MYKVAVLISGGGSNLQSIIDSIEKGKLNCSIETVIADREGCYGIERAKQKGIETHVLDRKVLKEGLSDEILKIINGRADLIVLAGFLSILKGELVTIYKDRIINIHPSLIPAFCGMGMHGIKVHEKALEYGVKVSGCTVHLVDEGTDTGPIVLQKTVCVYPDDTPQTLQKRVLEKEHEALPEAIGLFSRGLVRVDGRRVVIGGFKND